MRNLGIPTLAAAAVAGGLALSSAEAKVQPPSPEEVYGRIAAVLGGDESQRFEPGFLRDAAARLKPDYTFFNASDAAEIDFPVPQETPSTAMTPEITKAFADMGYSASSHKADDYLAQTNSRVKGGIRETSYTLIDEANEAAVYDETIVSSLHDFVLRDAGKRTVCLAELTMTIIRNNVLSTLVITSHDDDCDGNEDGQRMHASLGDEVMVYGSDNGDGGEHYTKSDNPWDLSKYKQTVNFPK